MKKILAATTMLMFFLLFEQSVEAQSPPSLNTLIRTKDSLFWKAYNACDTAGLRPYLTNDVEFYHDKGGAYYGAEALMESLKRKPL